MMSNISIYLRSGQTISVTGTVEKIPETDRVNDLSDRYRFDLQRGQLLLIDQREIVAVLSADHWS